MSVSEWVGSIGVGLLLLAYVLDVTDQLADDSPWFFGLNMIGASMASSAAFMIKFWPFVILEGVWALVSAGALVLRLRRGPKAN